MAEIRTKRQQQAAEMRAKIQFTALRLFADKGFENVSIDEIAKSAGCSVGNIYHYFPNKDSLTAMMTANVDMEYKALRKKFLQNHDVDIRDRLADFVGAALAIDSQEPLLYQCFVHSIKSPEAGVLKPDTSKEYFGMLYKLVSELHKTCDIKPGVTIEDTLHALIVLNRGLLIEWRIEEGGFDIAALGRKQARMIIEGILMV